jgi:hypothetical protein
VTDHNIERVWPVAARAAPTDWEATTVDDLVFQLEALAHRLEALHDRVLQELADVQEREIVLLAQLIRKTRQNFPDIAAWPVPESQPSWWDQP